MNAINNFLINFNLGNPFVTKDIVGFSSFKDNFVLSSSLVDFVIQASAINSGIENCLIVKDNLISSFRVASFTKDSFRVITFKDVIDS